MSYNIYLEKQKKVKIFLGEKEKSSTFANTKQEGLFV